MRRARYRGGDTGEGGYTTGDTGGGGRSLGAHHQCRRVVALEM